MKQGRAAAEAALPRSEGPLALRWTDDFVVASELRNAGADFSSASSDFKSLGAFFCNFPQVAFSK
jgi:hypothetical protein